MHFCCVSTESGDSDKKRRKAKSKSTKKRDGLGGKRGTAGVAVESSSSMTVLMSGLLYLGMLATVLFFMGIIFFFIGAPTSISKSASLHAPNRTYFAVNDDTRPMVTVGPCTVGDLQNNASVCYQFAQNATGRAEEVAIDMTPINRIGFFGTHNSYHSGSWLCAFSESGLPAEWCEKHPPYHQQWRSGATQYEIDLNSQVYDTNNITFYVYHISLLDTQSNDISLLRTLIELLTYMRESPRHAPVMIFFDPKGQTSPHNLCAEDTVVELHDLLKKVVPPEWMLLPKHVYQSGNAARSYVVEHGWPVLGSVRGSIMFVLSTYDKFNEPCAKLYREIYSHEDQLIFTYIDSDSALDSEIFYMSSHELEPADLNDTLVAERRLVRFDTSPPPAGTDPHINDTIREGYNIIATHSNEDNWCDVLTENHPVLAEIEASRELCLYMISGISQSQE